jgi:phosphatidylserine decarboxylase
MPGSNHQYICRRTGQIKNEKLFNDKLIQIIYSDIREQVPFVFNLLTSSRSSALLGFLNYDLPFADTLTGARNFLKRMGIDLSECVQPEAYYTTHRRLFERQIRFWECRKMDEAVEVIVAPADSRMLPGSLLPGSMLLLKGKFFEFEELIGVDKKTWLDTFAKGHFATFRLTPDKYHYNHFPVSGEVRDIYEIRGRYHSCNPEAVVEMVTPYSKNKRVVTIIDTDVPDGTGCGLVAMIEVVALMIGGIEQCYSHEHYDTPRSVTPGMFVRKGQPKSLYHPGSSLDVLFFEHGRMHFCEDILANRFHPGVKSRLSHGFGQPLVETDVQVRSTIGFALPAS